MADQAKQLIGDAEATGWEGCRKNFLTAHQKSQKLVTDAIRLREAADTADQTGKSSLVLACDILVDACRRQVDVEKEIVGLMDVSPDTYAEAFKNGALLWQAEDF